MKKVSLTTALRAYAWETGGQAWELLQDPSLSVKLESMAAGGGEQRHYHRQSRQFFFILQGKALIETDGTVTTLHREEGLYVPEGSRHRIYNPFDREVRFLVISAPEIGNDRINLKDD
ncbi:cupin domain-containing protein [Compostibacter hankyongensis]|uniref:Cupin type-2 domain-containing protein n=1 Tax=Compostibacter hankyongensis TaxID=1007089 RepID=A0ABP8FJM3_9BACT